MAAVKVLEPPLDAISRQARPYPAYLLPEGGTGLALFAAAFLGHNDAIHFARREMKGTCIDIDAEKLEEMRAVYPQGWQFFNADAWTWAQTAAQLGLTWDVVSVDTFQGDATERSLESLPLWCYLADSVVTATISRGMDYRVPDGWRSDVFPRSNTVGWLVLTHD